MDHSPDVYFVPLDGRNCSSNMAEQTEALMRAAGFERLLQEDAITAVKQHFGEQGNHGYIRPEICKSVVDLVCCHKGKPLVVETNTLYSGARSNTYDHLMLAREHGFSLETLGAPVVIMDGLNGQNQVEVTVNGKHFEKVFVAADLPHFHSMILLSHVKGHMMSAMGGAIKNLSMGLSSRAGKLAQHADFKPAVHDAECVRCRLCERHCPTDAIILRGDAMHFDESLCIGCGECYTACRYNAISFSWNAGGQLSERMAEQALGAVSFHPGKIGYVNFFNHVTKQCDCWDGHNPVEFDDVGLFAGFDPVAVDQACYDVARDKFGKDIFKDLWPNLDATTQLNYGERIGLGKRTYTLVKVTP